MARGEAVEIVAVVVDDVCGIPVVAVTEVPRTFGFDEGVFIWKGLVLVLRIWQKVFD